jgi:hypothetical protein
MFQFNYGTKPADQWWRLSCDCLCLFTLEEHTGKTVEEFFDVRSAYQDDVLEVAGQLLSRVVAAEAAGKSAAELATPESAPSPPLDRELNLLLTRAANLLHNILGVTSPRRKSDWYVLCWAMTQGWREDAAIPLTFREFLRVIPTGPKFVELTGTMMQLYLEHVKGVAKAGELGNASAPGQSTTGPASPSETTGLGASTSRRSVWVDDDVTSGEVALVPTTP